MQGRGYDTGYFLDSSAVSFEAGRRMRCLMIRIIPMVSMSAFYMELRATVIY